MKRRRRKHRFRQIREWTYASASHSHRFFLLIFLIALLLSGYSTAFGANWQTSPGLVSPRTAIRLAERFPNIASPQDLATILRLIGEGSPALFVEAYYRDGVWYIEGKKAATVLQIQFTATTRLLTVPLESLTQNFLAEPDTPELREKLTNLIKNYLHKRGYPQPDVTLKTETQQEGVIYIFKIEEGDPCIIEKISLPFALPAGMSLNVTPGDICDEEEVIAAITKLEDELKEEEYNQAQLEFDAFKPRANVNSATLAIIGALGQRIHYQIHDPTKTFNIGDLFSEDELSTLDPTLVGPDAMTSELERRYRGRGFDEVQIRGPRIKKLSENEIEYEFDVNPGPKYLLRSIQFEGTQRFSDSELLDAMGLTSIWQSSPPLNVEDIRRGVDALRAKYQAEGYWDVTIRDPRPARDRETASAQVVIHISEGLPRILKEITVDGNQALTDSEVMGMLGIQQGEPLNRGKLVDFENAIRETYINQGYLYARVNIDIKSEVEKKSIPTIVHVTIVEGVRVRIGEVRVVGLTKTDPKVVQRELRFNSGDFYDPAKIEASRQAITDLGLFRTVQIFPSDRNAMLEGTEELNLTIDAREGKAGNVSFGPGWGLSEGWRYNFETSYNNIGGVGRQVFLQGGFSQQVQQKAISSKTLVGRKFSIGYLEPYLLNLPVDGTISLSHRAQAYEIWELTRAGELALSHKFRNFLPRSTISLFYGQKINREEGTKSQQLSLVSTGNVRIGRMGVRFNLDRRNELTWPTKGYTIATEQSWARYRFGGDLQYFHWEITHNRYFKIWRDLVFAVSASVAAFEDIDRRGDDVDVLPSSERLRAGGADTVRGFRERTLGPKAVYPITDTIDGMETEVGRGSDFTGGSRRTILKFELRRLFSEHFAGTCFLDSGNAFFSQSEIDKFKSVYEVTDDSTTNDNDSTKTRIEDNIGYRYQDLLTHPGYLWSRHYVSYGLSLNYLTALGSINLAYGIPFHEPKTRRCLENPDNPDYCFPRGNQNEFWLFRGQFHINVGATF